MFKLLKRNSIVPEQCFALDNNFVTLTVSFIELMDLLIEYYTDLEPDETQVSNYVNCKINAQNMLKQYKNGELPNTATWSRLMTTQIKLYSRIQ